MKKPAQFNVLVACEESQSECLAFRAAGFNAFSCDLLPCSGGWPEFHIIGDALQTMYFPGTFITQHGERVEIPRWDLVIAHPPCTYMSKASARYMYAGGQINQKRWEEMLRARNFFLRCWLAPADFLAVENPVPLKCARLPKPSTYVDPTQFGHPLTKKTLLWLRNLPPLMPTALRFSRGSFLDHCATGRRSKSFDGISAAMAEQWGRVLLEDGKPYH